MAERIIIIIVLLFILTSCYRFDNTTTVDETATNRIKSVDEEGDSRIDIMELLLENLYSIEEVVEEDDLQTDETYYDLYDEYCLQEALPVLLRTHTIFREISSREMLIMKPSNIVISESFNLEADGTILNEYRTTGFTYRLDLELDYMEGVSESIVESGNINLKYVDDEWKVSLFKQSSNIKMWNDFIE